MRKCICIKRVYEVISGIKSDQNPGKSALIKICLQTIESANNLIFLNILGSDKEKSIESEITKKGFI